MHRGARRRLVPGGGRRHGRNRPGAHCPVAVLLNNAGVARPRAVEEITERDWDEAIDVNLKSVFLVTQAVLPGMRPGKWGAS